MSKGDFQESLSQQILVGRDTFSREIGRSGSKRVVSTRFCDQPETKFVYLRCLDSVQYHGVNYEEGGAEVSAGGIIIIMNNNNNNNDNSNDNNNYYYYQQQQQQ